MKSANNPEQQLASYPKLDLLDPVSLWKGMVWLRSYDERAVALQRQGRIGTYATFWGEEAVQVGAVAATRHSDWLFPTYRENGIVTLRGLPLERAWSYFRGDPGALFNPVEYGCAPQSVPLASHLSHAVGWAWSRMITGHDDVALAFFGDGASSEGEAHEALNLAGVMRAPVVFLCVNNQWAISTPVSRQTAAKQLVDKAIGYGISGERIDGFDVAEVAESLRAAVERARGGNGPSLIEAFCYRIGPHATADDPSLYRSSADEDHWRAMEPIGRIEELLIEEGLLSRSQAQAYREAVRTTMLEAAHKLDRLPLPDRSWLVKGTFSSMVPMHEEGYVK